MADRVASRKTGRVADRETGKVAERVFGANGSFRAPKWLPTRMALEPLRRPWQRYRSVEEFFFCFISIDKASIEGRLSVDSASIGKQRQISKS